MKIRNGFVSNSSSSSFLVAFDKVPESLEEVKNIMFPNEEYNKTEEGFEILNLANDIFKNLIKPLTKEEVLEIFKEGTSRYYGIERSREKEERSLRENGFKEESIKNLVSMYYFPKPSLEDCFCVDEKLYQNVLLEKEKTKQKEEEANDFCSSLKKTWSSQDPLIKNKIKEYYKQMSKEDKAEEKLAIKDGRHFFKKNKDKFIFYFEFSDHSFDGDYSPLESNDECWGNLKFICFSHH
jgi:hypothetical protein